MIKLTKINGDEFAVNVNLLTRVENRGDTIVFMSDGNDVLVRDSVDDIVAKVCDFQAQVMGGALRFAHIDLVTDASEVNP